MHERALMSVKEAAKYLHTTVSTLNTYRSTGRVKIPYLKVGAKILYDRRQLAQWLESCQADLDNKKRLIVE